MATLPDPRDYIISIDNPLLIKAEDLQGGNPIKKNGKLIRYTGGFCIVFPYEVLGNKYAVRCWKAAISDAKERTKLIAESIEKISLPYFVKFKYVDNGIVTPQGMQPIVLMDWVNAKTLKEYIKDNLYDKNKLNVLSDNFLQMVKDLHENNIAHGDLQHGNILVKNDGNLVLVDYDSMFVPTLDGWKDEIKGLIGYQHPARWSNKTVTAKLDYFSEKVIYLSIKALKCKPDLWNDLQIEDNETLLFTAEDIESKGTSPIFSWLRNEPELKRLSENIVNDLQNSSIDSLLPLEEILKSPLEDIFKGWKSYTPQYSPSYTNDDVNKITKGW